MATGNTQKVTKEELENNAKDLKEKIRTYMGEKKVKHNPLNWAIDNLIFELEEYENQMEDNT